VHYTARPETICLSRLVGNLQDKTEPGNIYRSCTILTRESVGVLKEIYHRMPVVLRPDAYDAWLNYDGQRVESLPEILSAWSVTEFRYYPVSKQVNRVGTNQPGTQGTPGFGNG